METKRYRLYYDEHCPLCVAYTSWFVKWGILPECGRLPFSKIENEHAEGLNRERARNEIALVEVKNGQVFYGMDSLLELLNSRFPFVKPMARLAPVYFLLRQVYAFISYNRKVIAGEGICNGKSCTPDFNVPYRWAFILFSGAISSFISALYLSMCSSVKPLVLFAETGIAAAVCSFVFFLMIIYTVRSKPQRLHLLGNIWAVLLTVHLLLLLPIVWQLAGLRINRVALWIYGGVMFLYTIRLAYQRVRNILF